MVLKKSKRVKKVKPRKNRVATAPTRDVIINIHTSKSRRAKTLKPIVNKSESLNRQDFQLSQAEFRNTSMIKEQAHKLGLIDKRLSVLTDIIDNDRIKPLFQATPANTPVYTPPTTDQLIFGIDRPDFSEETAPKKKGRPFETEELKQARRDSKKKAQAEQAVEARLLLRKDFEESVQIEEEIRARAELEAEVKAQASGDKSRKVASFFTRKPPKK